MAVTFTPLWQFAGKNTPIRFQAQITKFSVELQAVPWPMGPPEPRLEDEHEGRGASGLSHMGADSEMGKADYTLSASRGSLGPPHQPMRWALAQQENANICNLLGVEKETEVPLSENAGPWGQTVGTEPGLAAWSLRLRRPSRAIGNGPQLSANNQDDPRAPLEAGAVPLLPFAAAHCWCCGKAQDQDALAARPCGAALRWLGWN